MDDIYVLNVLIKIKGKLCSLKWKMFALGKMLRKHSYSYLCMSPKISKILTQSISTCIEGMLREFFYLVMRPDEHFSNWLFFFYRGAV